MRILCFAYMLVLGGLSVIGAPFTAGKTTTRTGRQAACWAAMSLGEVLAAIGLYFS